MGFHVSLGEYRVILGLSRDNGKEHGNFCNNIGYYWGYIGTMEKRNFCLGCRVEEPMINQPPLLLRALILGSLL